MKQLTIFPFGGTKALPVAVHTLKSYGFQVTQVPQADVTHLLLPCPSFDEDGTVRGGGEPEEILAQLPPDITVIGGRLSHPCLAGLKKIDLLQDEQYLAENAELTAESAVEILRNLLPVRLRGLPVLVLGWGRIGKCLGKILQQAGAKVQIAARKETDRAMISALGYEAVSPGEITEVLPGVRVIFNTVPAMMLTEQAQQNCRPDCIKIELASECGIEGSDVFIARGLPGKYLPESSGVLMADTIARLIGKREGTL